jgi:hypothetical protein
MNGAIHGCPCHLGRMSKSGHEDIAAFPVHKRQMGDIARGIAGRMFTFATYEI